MGSPERVGDRSRLSEQQTVLQQSNARDGLLDMFLPDVSPVCDAYPREPVEMPSRESIFRVAGHFAVKRPPRPDVFKHAGDPGDVDVYQVSLADVLTVLTEYDVALKTAAYPNSDPRLVAFNAFEHGLNDEILPRGATYTRFITGAEINNSSVLYTLTAGEEATVDESEVVGGDFNTIERADFDTVVEPVSSLYPVSSPVIPENWPPEQPA